MTIGESTLLLSKKASVELLADMLKQAEEDKTELLEALQGILSDICIDTDELAPALNALAAIRYQARAAIEKVETS